jgi:hypothetical protein
LRRSIVKYDNLRLALFAKRKLLSKFGFKPSNAVSLNRGEKPALVDTEFLGVYSKASYLEIDDLRTNTKRGHYFNERNFFKLSNVIIEPHQGLIWDARGKFIEESSNYPTYQTYSSFPWNPNSRKVERVSGTYLFLPTNGYWHWLVEDLPSFLFLTKLFPNLRVLIKSNPPKFISDFLSKLDIDIKFVDGPVLAENLLFVEKKTDSGWLHPSDLNVLREFDLFSKALSSAKPNRLIYAKRMVSKRVPCNETEIAALFKSYGFELVVPEELDLIDEARLFSETQILASVHGSALTNMIWMQQNTSVFDIVNENYWTEAAFSVLPQVGVKYNYSVYPGESNTKVDLIILAKDLEKILEKE